MTMPTLTNNEPRAPIIILSIIIIKVVLAPSPPPFNCLHVMYSNPRVLHLAEPAAVEQHNQLPILAEAGRGAAHQSLHLQCDESGRVSGRREATTGRGGPVRVPRGHGEDEHPLPRQLHGVVPAQEDPPVRARAERGQESQDSHTKYSVAGKRDAALVKCWSVGMWCGIHFGGPQFIHLSIYPPYTLHPVHQIMPRNRKYCPLLNSSPI